MILKGYEFEMSGVKRVCGRAVCRSKGEPAAWIDVRARPPKAGRIKRGIKG